MTDSSIFWLCILIIAIGIAAIAGIVWFGQFLFRIHFGKRFPGDMFWEEILHRWFKDPHSYEDIPRYVSESYTEYLQRRNEYWTTYGQVIIAVLMIIVLTILLLSKAITAEAGLPILSGITGFAIAKGVSSSRSISMPQERQRG